MNSRRVRIALVHMRHCEVGGTERYLNQVARHLVESGDDVTIVCRSHEGSPHPGVKFLRLRSPALGATWRMWAFARAVEAHVRNSAYDVVFGLGKSWTHDVIRLGGGLHETYIELAYVQRPWDFLVGGVSLKHRAALAIERRALAPGATRHVITNSEMVKQDVIRRYGIANARIHVIYNGVDLERFHPRWRETRGMALRAQCGFDATNFVVLFLGTEYGRKGLRRLLRIFPALLRERPQCRLLVVGFDSNRARYEREARAAGLAGVTRFLGGRRDAEACFAAGDLYVLPTLYDPFANSTLEALASGLPVITTSANGAGELITPRVEGSVIEARDLDVTLFEELLFWTDRARVRAASIAARRLAERYPQDATAAMTRTVLEKVLREKSGRSAD